MDDDKNIIQEERPLMVKHDEKPKTKIKLHGIIFGILIILLAGATGFFGFYWWQNKDGCNCSQKNTSKATQTSSKQTSSANSNSPAAIPAVTAPINLKTFSSTPFGFSIQYPDNWKLASKDISGFGKPGVELTNPTSTTVNIKIFYYSNLKTMAPTTTATTLLTYLEDGSPKEITVNSQKAIEATSTGTAGAYSVYFEKNAHIWQIEFKATDKTKLTTDETKILNSFSIK